MAVKHVEEVRDDHGDTWIFETRICDGFARCFLTPPGGERRELLHRNHKTARPQRDADEALPLDLR